ncbi:ABC transporter permease subunit [Verminephrobacter eiseniae]|uniref:ABC transporter permease n=1 Tax=Verminephrobacter eiseniae TaxID=364317 RepID=UPI0022381FDC|nr:ABC transporter permease subunit [Verminephrobacter eiseniae]MCW5262865.1 ABC transporter permease subunit [Verminephrobacter eiseniae]
MLIEHVPHIAAGVTVTMTVALGSLAVAVALGLVGAACKLSGSRLLTLLAATYSTLVRGVPELVWLLFLFYGAQILINQTSATMGWQAVEIDPMLAGITTIGFIFGAYMTETFRAAIMAVPSGQAEAGLSFGMSPLRVFWRITLPQMVRFALPSFSNNWMVLIKSTALVSVIGLNDLMHRAAMAKSATRDSFGAYLVVCVIYLIITGVSIAVFRLLELRFSRGVRGADL